MNAEKNSVSVAVNVFNILIVPCVILWNCSAFSGIVEQSVDGIIPYSSYSNSIADNQSTLLSPWDSIYVHHHPDPVNLRNGNLSLYYRDIHIPYFSSSIDIVRIYNSRGTRSGLFGFGWSTNGDIRLKQKDAQYIQIVEANGSITKYRMHAFQSGEKVFFSSTGKSRVILDPKQSTYTRINPCGLTELFNKSGYLSGWSDGDGHSAEYQYDNNHLTQIVDGAGRQILLSYNRDGFIEKITDPAKRIFQYQYDTRGNLIKTIFPGNRITRFVYDDGHNLSTIVYPDHKKTDFIYDQDRDLLLEEKGPGIKHTTYAYNLISKNPWKQRTILTDSNGHSTEYIYSSLNDIIQLKKIDPLGRKTVKQYDKQGNLIAFTGQSGETTRYTFNQEGLVKSITDQDGSKYLLDYDKKCGGHKPDKIFLNRQELYHTECTSKGKIRKIVYRDGQAKSKFYDAENILNKTVDEAGNTLWFKHDNYGNTIIVDGSDGSSMAYKYDILGRLTELGLGQTEKWQYFYDESGELSRIKGPDQVEYKFDYDHQGRITSFEGADGALRQFRYNGQGLLTESINPTETATLYGYDALGNLTDVTDPSGNLTRYIYDNVNRLVTVIYADGATSRISYDTADNVIKITDPEGSSYKFEYDEQNKLITTILPNGRIQRYQYNQYGNKTATVLANGDRVTNTYNQFQHLKKVVHNSMLQAEYAYDSHGNLTSITDGAGRNINILYDSIGRMTAVTDFNGRTRQYSRDPEGRIISFVEHTGFVYKTKYDQLGRIAKIQILNAKGRPVKKHTLEYDRSGHLTKSSANDADVTLQYDEDGRLVSVTDSLISQSVSNDYNRRDQPVSVRINDKKYLTFTYDSRNRLQAVQNKWKEKFIFSYNLSGMLTKVSYPNGVRTYFVYDLLGRLSKIVVRGRDGNILRKTEYQWDDAGNITQVVEDGEAITYRYNDANFLIAAQTTYTAGSHSFLYDWRSNLLQARSGNGPVRHYRYNEQDQLIKSDEQSLTYDPSGNLASVENNHGRRVYQHDAEGLLAKVLLSGNREITYQYDGLGRKISRLSADEEVYYLYDGVKLLAVLDSHREIASFFTHGPGMNHLLSVRRKGKSYFYHTDLLGSVRMITDDEGNIVEKFSYTPYGELLDEDKGVGLPFRFAGGILDPDTGLYYFRNRNYSPEYARFIEQDPIEYLAENFNYYSYVGNNPVSRIDPLGLEFKGLGNMLGDWMFGSGENHFLERAKRGEFKPGKVNNSSDSGWRPYFFGTGGAAGIKNKTKVGFANDLTKITFSSKTSADTSYIKPHVRVGVGARKNNMAQAGDASLSWGRGRPYTVQVDNKGNIKAEVNVGNVNLTAKGTSDEIEQGEISIGTNFGIEDQNKPEAPRSMGLTHPYLVSMYNAINDAIDYFIPDVGIDIGEINAEVEIPMYHKVTRELRQVNQGQECNH